MAVNFVARKCACGGKLEFEPVKKIWVCRYCGTIVEREATFDKIHVDGIEGIEDVVRQTLMDIANQKMDNAARNLEDCERKNHTHIGTLLAHISYSLTAISVAKSQDDVHANLNKVKIYTKRLHSEYPEIAEDEINLYESFKDGSSDVYANLLVTFDTIGEQGRAEYIASKLKPEEVFSVHTNRSLLKISIKNGDLETVDKIITNMGHIDRVSAAQEILDKYSDISKKGELIDALLDNYVAERSGKKFFENYFTTSKDSIKTKCKVISLLNETEVHCSVDMVVKAVSWQLDDYDKSRLLFDTLYDIKTSDQETEELLVFCLIVNKSYDMQAAFFDTLIDKSVFVALNGKTVISFLDSSDFPAGKKSKILKKFLSFEIDNKALDAICNYYLNNNTDSAEDRKCMIDVLLFDGIPISANTVRTYVVKTNTDLGNKKCIIEKIFSTGINKTYLGNILSEYMIHTLDDQIQKKTIINYFIEQGFKVDSETFSQFAASDEAADNKLEIMKQLVSNGTIVKADTLSRYILSLKKENKFSADIFDLLTCSNYLVSYQAYAKFVLSCKDSDKVRHNEMLVNSRDFDFFNQKLEISHCGVKLNCNIVQAYLLLSLDEENITKQILQQILAKGIKINSEVLVNGNRIKFRKYVCENEKHLSPLSYQLCEENKLFSWF